MRDAALAWEFTSDTCGLLVVPTMDRRSGSQVKSRRSMAMLAVHRAIQTIATPSNYYYSLVCTTLFGFFCDTP
jgi:hypothetical protein